MMFCRTAIKTFFLYFLNEFNYNGLLKDLSHSSHIDMTSLVNRGVINRTYLGSVSFFVPFPYTLKGNAQSVVALDGTQPDEMAPGLVRGAD